MKKIYLLFVAASLAACSAEPEENDVLDSLNAAVTDKKNVAAAEVEDYLDYPASLCVGKEGTFTFKFEGKRNGSTLLKLDVYRDNPETVEIDFDWINIDQKNSKGEGYQEQNMFYTFHAIGTYEMRYQIGGSPVEFSVDVVTCEPICAKGKGYWTNHGPLNPGNQENAYPEGGVVIGGTSYLLSELQEILKTNGNTGDVFKLKQHLIVAILNIANGVDGSSISQAIEEANEIILASGTGYTTGQIEDVKDELENFSTSKACEDFEE